MIHERDRQRNGQTAHRNCDHSCTFGSTRCSRLRRHCCTCPARPHSFDRHCAWITKFCWSGCVLPSVTISCMVSVLSRWTHAARSLWRHMFYSYRHHLSILFIIYTVDLASIVAQHGLSLHQYADDSQVYGSSCQSDATSTLSSDITECVDDMYSWMRLNRLQLNGEKTEMMWCSSTRRLSQLPNSSIVVAGANVHPVSTVRDLGVYTDTDTGTRTYHD